MSQLAESELAVSRAPQDGPPEATPGAHTVATDMGDQPATERSCAVCGALIVPTRKLRKPRKERLYCSEHCRYLAWRRRNLKPVRKPRRPRPSDQLPRLTIRLLPGELEILTAAMQRYQLPTLQTAASACLMIGLRTMAGDEAAQIKGLRRRPLTTR
jgi:hypothetical protein